MNKRNSMISGRTAVVACVLIAASQFNINTANAVTPTIQLSSAPLVTPTNAWTYYGSSTVHTNGPAAWSTRAPEVKSLARGLGAELVPASLTANDYAKRVFDYVLNNIDVEFRFGLGKGARGAVIDQSGTAFDQAQLMVDLLREANITAGYRVGTITLTPQQFGQWTGLVHTLTQATPPALPTFTVNAQAACQFLADGGIPATVNSATSCTSLTGSLTTVTLGHIWVSANSKLYDPSFKRYNLRKGVDIAQRMGCGTDASPTCGTTATNAALIGAAYGSIGTAPTLSNLNTTQLATNLQTFATNMQSHVETNLPDASLEEVIGGRIVDITYAPAIGTTLPHSPTITTQFTWSGDIPNQFRTKAKLHLGDINSALYADEIFGKRLELVCGLVCNAGWVFNVDDVTVAIHNNVIPPGVSNPAGLAELSIDHPYAADLGTYGDRFSNVYVNPQINGMLVISVGNTGAGLPKHFADREHVQLQPPSAEGYGDGGVSPFPIFQSWATLLSAQFLYQESLALDMFEGVSKTRVTQHHVLGIAGGFGNSLNLESQVSVTSVSNNVTHRKAAFRALAEIVPMMEGSVTQQQNDSWSPTSMASCVQTANQPDINGLRRTFVLASQANIEPVLSSMTQSYRWGTVGIHSSTRDRHRATAAEGFDQILLLNAAEAPFNVANGTIDYYLACYGAYSDSGIGLFSGSEKGGSAWAGPMDPLEAAKKAVEMGDYGARKRTALGVDLATGSATLTATADLVTGVGEFPYSLSFQRTYSTNNDYRFPDVQVATGYLVGDDSSKYYGSDKNTLPRIGSGWTHNFQISAALLNDGVSGLGARRGLDAVAAIAGFYTMFDIHKASNSDKAVYFQRQLSSIFAAHWVSTQFMQNSFGIERASGGGESFVRLPSGAYRPHSATSARLAQLGTRSGPYKLDADPLLPTDPRYSRVAYNYAGVNFRYTDTDGAVMSFSSSESYGTYYGPINSPVFRIDNWVFPSGVAISFQYDASTEGGTGRSQSFLRMVSNNLGRSITINRRSGDYWDTIASVSDETSRAVQFVNACRPCFTLDVIAPDTKRTRYEYENFDQGQAYLARPNYKLKKWFTPDDLNSAYLRIEYDNLFRVKSVVDKAGVPTRYYSVGLIGRENQKRGDTMDALGAVSTKIFNKDSAVTMTIDPLGASTWNTYDDRKRLKSTVYPEGNSVEYTYDVRGNVLTERKKPKSGSAWMALTTTNTYMEGPTVTACANPATCNKIKTTSDYKNRIVGNYDYNALGQPTQMQGAVLADSTRSQSNYCYTTLGGMSLLTGKIDVVGGGKPNRITKFDYNAASKYVLSAARVDPIGSTDLLTYNASTKTCSGTTKSTGKNLVTSLTFDPIGNVRSIDGPRAGTEDTTTYTFDVARRLKEVDVQLGSDPQYAVTKYEYYTDGSLWTTSRKETIAGSPVWRTDSRTYYPTGELMTATDPEGNVTRYAYDVVGRQTLVFDPEGRGVGTVYDLAGKPACTWKGWEFLIAPNTCTWNPSTYSSAANDGAYRYVAYGYSLNGKQTTITDANNNVTQYAYDKHDRLRYTLFPAPTNGALCTASTAETVSVLTCPTGATYEELRYSTSGAPAANDTALCNGSDAVCTKRTRGNQTLAFTFDEINRIKTKAVTGLPLVTNTYNLLSEPLTITSPSQTSPAIPAHRIAYDYDDIGKVLYEENTLNGTIRRVSYQYDQIGNRSRTTWPDSYFVSYEYDALNRMTGVWEGAINSPTKLAAYDYDTLSRRKGLQYANNVNNRVSYTYEVDSQLDVLSHVLSSTQVNLDYGHNSAGQINKIAANNDFYLPSPATENTTYVADKLNRYSSRAGQTLTYDANGNMLTWFPTGGKHTYTYDAENRLRTAAINGSSTASITYDYDPLGRRLSKTVSGTASYFLLDDDEEIAEYNAAGTVLRRYITGPAIDDRIARAEGAAVSNPTKYYYHTNHQGSVIAMTDSTGLITQQLAYDEYGNLTSTPPAVGTGEIFRYTGRRYDDETKLYYYRARYYSPVLGRFLQTDPIGYKDDFNLYAYVGNNPVNKTDPTGMCEITNCQTMSGYLETLRQSFSDQASEAVADRTTVSASAKITLGPIGAGVSAKADAQTLQDGTVKVRAGSDTGGVEAKAKATLDVRVAGPKDVSSDGNASGQASVSAGLIGATVKTGDQGTSLTVQIGPQAGFSAKGTEYLKSPVNGGAGAETRVNASSALESAGNAVKRAVVCILAECK